MKNETHNLIENATITAEEIQIINTLESETQKF